MNKINPTMKSPVAQFLLNNEAVTKYTDKISGTTQFFTPNNKYLGTQSRRVSMQRDSFNNLEKRIMIKRDICEQFPKRMYEQYILIEQKLRNVFRKSYADVDLMPTSVKTTKFTIDRKNNLMTLEKVERSIEKEPQVALKVGNNTFYSLEDNPKFLTKSVTKETKPYTEDPRLTYNIWG